MNRKEYLITVNGNHVLRVALIEMEFNTKEYIINRTTWQFDGVKKTKHPTQRGFIGFNGKNIIQQAEFEFNKLIQYYIKLKYKVLSESTKKKFDTLTKDDLLKIYSNIYVDDKGIPKPMLPKHYLDCPTKSLDSKDYYCCQKLNGVRCLIYYNNEEIKTSLNVTTSLNHIINNNQLKKFFTDNPNIILDGEIYYHGFSLNYLNELIYSNENQNILEYWIYDYISEDNFNIRFNNLMNWKDILTDNCFNIINHYLLNGWSSFKRKHDEFVKKGFEGLILRNTKKPYGIGLKSSLYMIEMIMNVDNEYTVVGYERGLRPIEDMCFICRNKNNKTFKVKPVNNINIKHLYIQNIENLINQQCIVKSLDIENDYPIYPIFKQFYNFL